jgi:hypothetical protein
MLPPQLIYYPIPMPMTAILEPSVNSSPIFEGADITHFIRRIVGIYKRYSIRDDERFLRTLPEYCSWIVRS